MSQPVFAVVDWEVALQDSAVVLEVALERSSQAVVECVAAVVNLIVAAIGVVEFVVVAAVFAAVVIGFVVVAAGVGLAVEQTY